MRFDHIWPHETIGMQLNVRRQHKHFFSVFFFVEQFILWMLLPWRRLAPMTPVNVCVNPIWWNKKHIIKIIWQWPADIDPLLNNFYSLSQEVTKTCSTSFTDESHCPAPTYCYSTLVNCLFKFYKYLNFNTNSTLHFHSRRLHSINMVGICSTYRQTNRCLWN